MSWGLCPVLSPQYTKPYAIDHPCLRCWSDYFAKLVFAEQIHSWEQLNSCHDVMWRNWLKNWECGTHRAATLKSQLLQAHQKLLVIYDKIDVPTYWDVPIKWMYLPLRRYILLALQGLWENAEELKPDALFYHTVNKAASQPTVSGAAHLW